jgi:hypothetical protein
MSPVRPSRRLRFAKAVAVLGSFGVSDAMPTLHDIAITGDSAGTIVKVNSDSGPSTAETRQLVVKGRQIVINADADVDNHDNQNIIQNDIDINSEATGTATTPTTPTSFAEKQQEKQQENQQMGLSVKGDTLDKLAKDLQDESPDAKRPPHEEDSAKSDLCAHAKSDFAVRKECIDAAARDLLGNAELKSLMSEERFNYIRRMNKYY